MYTMKHSWNNEEKRHFLETHTAVGVNAMGETLYVRKEEPDQIEEPEQIEEPKKHDKKYRVTNLLGSVLDELKPMRAERWKAYAEYDGEDDDELESVESAYYAIDYVYGLVLQRYHEVCEHESNNGSVNWKRICELFMQELQKCEWRAHQNQRSEAEAVYKEASKLFSRAWAMETNRLARR